MDPTLRFGVLTGLLMLLPACERTPSGPLARPGGPRDGDSSTYFRPEPDPPAIVLSFTLAGSLNAALRGTFTIPGCALTGQLTVTNLLPAVQRGATLQLAQSWSLVQPGPCRGPTLPGGAWTLGGMLNTETGLLVLSGRLDDGSSVHVLATLAPAGSAIAGSARVTSAAQAAATSTWSPPSP